MSDKRCREKINCFEEWMKGDHVMVHLDSRKAGVVVPGFHADNHSLTLQLSYAFRGETTHDDSEIRSYLKFHGEYSECVLPWTAIWGLSSSTGDSRIWPHDMPKELIVKMAQSRLQAVGKKLFGLDSKKSKNEKKASSSQSASANLRVSDTTNEKNGATKRTPELKRVK